MIFRNIKLAFRNILKNKGISFINILGLAIGMMAVLLIFQYIGFEKSYDKFIDNADRLHRLVFYRYYKTGLDKSAGNNYYVGQIAYEKIPEIENFCRCKKETQYVMVHEQIYKEERTLFADSSYFDLFSHIIVSGDRKSFLRQPGVAILTESLAKKYFGDEDPVGKIIFGVNPGKKPVVVQGVIKDVPHNSHLKFDLAVSLMTLTDSSYCYSCNNTNTYFLLREGADPVKIENDITKLAMENFISRGAAIDFPVEFHLQPVTDIHLHSRYRFEHEMNGNAKYISILLATALLILISAGLNYLNLFSSIAARRINGIGIRIVNGATNMNIIGEFITEALLTGFISFLLSYLLLFLLFPLFQNFLNLNFSLETALIIRTWLLPLCLLILLSLFVGFLLGLRILNVAPVSFIKKELVLRSRKFSRTFLLVLQFVISIILFGSTIGVIKQIDYMQREAFTMDIDQVLVVKRPVARQFNPAQNAFQESILKIPGITDFTFSTISPGEKNSWVKGGIALKGEEKLDFQFFQADVASDFFDFFKVRLIAGRHFFKDETNWSGGPRHLILNREAAMAFGKDNINDLIGKNMFDYDSNPQQDMGEIVGIIDGYFQNSLDQEIKPTIFNCDQGGYYIFIKIYGKNIPDIVEKVKTEFKENFEGQYFEYYFLDEFFNTQYKSHIQLFRCFALFSILAIIIISLSLFGLVMMISVTHTKEIGIRKVNGATVRELLLMLTGDYVVLIGIAFIIATPVIWFVLNLWLKNFAYKTELRWWIFALAGLLAIIIALLTVSWQSLRTATRNPVESLRYE